MRVATIGAGYFSQFHHEAWARLPSTVLAAVCDRDEAAACNMAEAHGAHAIYTDAAQMLDAVRPDIVDIITPPATHKALITLAAERGIATICQKAFCQSLQEAREAAAIAREAGIPLVVHENFRFSPWYREMARLLDEGLLGTLYGATFRLRPGDGQGPDAYLQRQPYFQTMERFLIHETAIHFIDTFRFLFGPTRSVYADLRRLNPAIKGEDAGLVVFDHGNGVRAVFDGNRLSDHVAQNRRLTMGELVVEGSAGTLRLDGDGGLHIRRFGENTETPHPYAWDNRGFAGDAVYRLQAHVVDHLHTGSPLENTAEAYLANLEVEEAIYRANQDGRQVEVPAGL